MKKTITAIATLCLCSAPVLSGEYTGPEDVLRLSSLSGTGNFEIYGNWQTQECSNTSKFIVGNHSTDTEISQQAKYSTILAAYMAGKTVELYIDGCTGTGYPIVKGIYVPSRN